jgi:hypothetical protein
LNCTAFADCSPAGNGARQPSLPASALKKMMKTPGHTVIFGSVKLDLGREIVRKESAEIQKAFLLLAEMAKKAKAKLDMVEDGSDKSIALLDADALAGIYEAQRLEFRLYHSNSVYSRTKVVALTPDAVGETGDLIMDEIGRAKRFREVLEAVMPIIASNPNSGRSTRPRRRRTIRIPHLNCWRRRSDSSCR